MKILLTPLFIAAVFLLSCQKEVNKPGDPAEEKCILDSIVISDIRTKLTYNGDKIITATPSDGTMVLLEYNSTGQLVKVEEQEGNSLVRSKREISYDNTGKITEEKYMYFDNVFSDQDKYNIEYLNEKPAQVKEYHYNTTANNYEYSGKMVYIWVNDNLTVITDYDEADALILTTTFTYDVTKENTFRNMGNFSLIAGGVPNGEDLQTAFYYSKNIMIKAEEDGFDIRRYSFDYTYNDKNNISTITSTNLDSGNVEDIQEFFYKCN